MTFENPNAGVQKNLTFLEFLNLWNGTDIESETKRIHYLTDLFREYGEEKENLIQEFLKNILFIQKNLTQFFQKRYGENPVLANAGIPENFLLDEETQRILLLISFVPPQTSESTSDHDQNELSKIPLKEHIEQILLSRTQNPENTTESENPILEKIIQKEQEKIQERSTIPNETTIPETKVMPLPLPEFLKKIHPQDSNFDHEYLKILLTGGKFPDENQEKELEQNIGLYLQDPRQFQQIEFVVKSLWKNNEQNVGVKTQQVIASLALQTNVMETYHSMVNSGGFTNSAFPSEKINALAEGVLSDTTDLDLSQLSSSLRGLEGDLTSDATKAMIAKFGILNALSFMNLLDQGKELTQSIYSYRVPKIRSGTISLGENEETEKPISPPTVHLSGAQIQQMNTVSLGSKQEQVNAQGETEPQYTLRIQQQYAQQEEARARKTAEEYQVAQTARIRAQEQRKRGWAALSQTAKISIVTGAAGLGLVASSFYTIFSDTSGNIT